MDCTNEGKIFAFIGLHNTKTTCFALDKVTFPMGLYHLLLTKTTCFDHKIMIASQKIISPPSLLFLLHNSNFQYFEQIILAPSRFDPYSLRMTPLHCPLRIYA